MKYVCLPEKPIRRLSFYLATEEYIARNYHSGDYFFMWQVAPSVIFGRNQLIDSEVNLTYCKENGIQTFRRKSGGGCVYSDPNNLMLSYITDDTAVHFTFDKYIRMVTHMLRKLGVPALPSGRNDITIDGRKVSGNAFYHLPGKSIVHGTLLFDTNIDHMVRSITPSDEKLVSKGVQSCRQRVINLKECLPDLPLSELKAFIRKELCGDEVLELNEEDVHRIEEIEKEYLTHEFIYGNNPRCTMSHKKRIEGVGDLEVRMEVKSNIIRHINLVGDYFMTGDLDKELLEPLKGVEYTREAVEKALEHTDVGAIIQHMDKQQFLELIF